MKLVQIIADYAPGDLAVAEVLGALSTELSGNYRWHFTSVQSFDTVSTGFAVAQLGLQAQGASPENGTIIYANCAPRQDLSSARHNNEGEGLLYGILENDIPVVVVNSGYSLSFIRGNLKELYKTNANSGGSQFRSRDIFPRVVGQVAKGDLSFIGDRLDPERVIPAVPISSIAYVDSFGNLKTTIRDGDPLVRDLVPGQRVHATIQGIERTLTVAAGSFNVEEGDIAFAPGSSGYGQRFWEIFQRGGSAFESYGRPRAGTKIELR